jgi:hypothetical protein
MTKNGICRDLGPALPPFGQKTRLHNLNSMTANNGCLLHLEAHDLSPKENDAAIGMGVSFLRVLEGRLIVRNPDRPRALDKGDFAQIPAWDILNVGSHEKATRFLMIQFNDAKPDIKFKVWHENDVNFQHDFDQGYVRRLMHVTDLPYREWGVIYDQLEISASGRIPGKASRLFVGGGNRSGELHVITPEGVDHCEFNPTSIALVNHDIEVSLEPKKGDGEEPMYLDLCQTPVRVG